LGARPRQRTGRRLRGAKKRAPLRRFPRAAVEGVLNSERSCAALGAGERLAVEWHIKGNLANLGRSLTQVIHV